MASGSTAIRLLGWVCYLASAIPFIAFLVAFFSVGLSQPLNIIIANLSIFAAAGVTAILVKHVAFNLVMAVAAMPYAVFLLERLGTATSRWSAMEIKGSVAYISIYCLIGCGSTAVWILVLLGSIRRRPPPGP